MDSRITVDAPRHRRADPRERSARLRRTATQAALLAACGLLAYAPLLASHWAAYGSPFLTGQATFRTGLAKVGVPGARRRLGGHAL